MQKKVFPHPLERAVAVITALYCLGVSAWWWRTTEVVQTMWPLPALYFIEMVVFALLAALTFIYGGIPGRAIVWAAAGTFAAFAVLGAFTVGLSYIPVSLGFLAISLTADIRDHAPILPHLGTCLLAAILQAVLMMILIRFV